MSSSGGGGEVHFEGFPHVLFEEEVIKQSSASSTVCRINKHSYAGICSCSRFHQGEFTLCMTLQSAGGWCSVNLS